MSTRFHLEAHSKLDLFKERRTDTSETSFGLEPAQGHNGVRGEDGSFFLSLPARRYRVG